MRFSYLLVVTLLILPFNLLQAKSPSRRAHENAHSELLANAKSSIDRSVIQDQMKFDIESKENIDPVFGTLSKESITMIQDLLSEAKTHTGKRYGRGSKGPNRFDCSGFTGYVYNQFGYKLNASSSSQYYDGEAVGDDELRPGDLVFFKGRSINGGVGHVGIVVTADNENHTFTFIHAAIGAGIEIQSSTAPYYQKRYVGARRIITE